MQQVTAVDEQEARQRPTSSRAGFLPIGRPAERAGTPEQFEKLRCFLCSTRFVVDLEEVWSVVSDEAELVGRQFVGVSPDAALCGACLRDVELAGAERMYWRLAYR